MNAFTETLFMAGSANLLKYLTVYLLSTFKFIGGPLAGTAMGLPLYLTMLLTVAGMMSSVLFFSIGGRMVYNWYIGRRRGQKKNIFNKSSRRIVKVWQKFGLKGIAFFTPLFFTPIIGTLVAVVLGASRPKIVLYMLGSAVIWSVTISLAIYGLKDTLHL